MCLSLIAHRKSSRVRMFFVFLPANMKLFRRKKNPLLPVFGHCYGCSEQLQTKDKCMRPLKLAKEGDPASWPLVP